MNIGGTRSGLVNVLVSDISLSGNVYEVDFSAALEERNSGKSLLTKKKQCCRFGLAQLTNWATPAKHGVDVVLDAPQILLVLHLWTPVWQT